MKVTSLVAKIAMYLIMALSVIFAIGSATEGDAMAEGSMTGVIITWTILVLAIGIAGAIISEVFGAITNSGNILKSLVIVVAGVAIIAICWALSDGTPLNLPGYEGSENQSPWLEIADTGIYLFYLSAGVAVLSIIASEIYQMFK